MFPTFHLSLCDLWLRRVSVAMLVLLVLVLGLWLPAGRVSAQALTEPVIVQDTLGASRVMIGKPSASSTDFRSGSITLQGPGTLGLFDSGNSWGTFTGPANGATVTREISVTFDDAETDVVNPDQGPNYEIFLVTRGLTPTSSAAPFSMGDRYANGFQVINTANNNSSVTGVWFKVRTGTPAR